MKNTLVSRSDLYASANLAHFQLCHYARGTYVVSPLVYAKRPFLSMPLNRMFFPLHNPSKKNNYIAERGKKFILEERHLYFIPCGYPVRFQLDNELEFLSIQFKLELFPGVDIFSNCGKMLDIPNPDCLDTLLRFFDTAPDRLPFVALTIRGVLEAYISELSGYYPKKTFQDILNMTGIYTPILRYLERTCSARTRVSELAAQIPETRESFTRKFSKRTNISPKKLINRVLIEKAVNLLIQDRSVKETAAELFFSNEFVFSNFFKRETGVSPMMWKHRIHDIV